MIPSGMFKNIGKDLLKSAWSGMGGAGRSAIIGAGVGGIYGAMSSNTSVMGGAMMGAGAGLGVRYAKAGYRSLYNYAAGPMSMKGAARAFGGGVQRRAMRDFGVAAVRANKGFNSFKGLFI